MGRQAVLAAFVLLLASASVPLATADEHCDRESRITCGQAGDGDFGVGISDGSPGGDGAAGNPGIHISNSTSPLRQETLHLPTCSGNTPGSDELVCTAAMTTCPDEREVRFWVYRRTVDSRIPGDDRPWERDTTPPTVCLRADDPVLAPTVSIPALVQRDFKRVVVLKGVAEVSPRPDTLVNIATLFTTSTPESYDIPLTLLGQSVVITATAQRWTWHFGDGASAITTAQGTRGRVEHEYARSGDLEAYVVIEWSGTFRIGGGPSRPIAGTATTTGDPVPVGVRQARAQLVDSSG